MRIDVCKNQAEQQKRNVELFPNVRSTCVWVNEYKNKSICLLMISPSPSLSNCFFFLNVFLSDFFLRNYETKNQMQKKGYDLRWVMFLFYFDNIEWGKMYLKWECYIIRFILLNVTSISCSQRKFNTPSFTCRRFCRRSHRRMWCEILVIPRQIFTFSNKQI